MIFCIITGMYHFFIKNENIAENRVMIEGNDYNHAVNVLRLRPGEKVLLSDEEGRDLYCTVSSERDEKEKILWLTVDRVSEENHELPARITLYQSLPKSDKMELIIQKATELGVTEIVPVESRNCIAKLEPKKAAAKATRWQSIAEAAAKQSKRSVVPEVREPMPFVEAVKEAESRGSLSLIPYEEERGMAGTCRAIIEFIPGADISVFIGPEGGYDPMEIRFSENHGVLPISLGKRILRTETAAITVLSLIMIRLEIAAEEGLLSEENQ